MHRSFQPSTNLVNFGVDPQDPGFLYFIRANGLIKIGRTTKPQSRLLAAKTWLPDADVIGFKPFWNHSQLERYLQLGLTNFWYKGEWYKFDDDPFGNDLVEIFCSFDDYDINNNSINFTYFMNSSGLSDLTIEFDRQSTTKPKFQTANTIHGPKKGPNI